MVLGLSEAVSARVVGLALGLRFVVLERKVFDFFIVPLFLCNMQLIDDFLTFLHLQNFSLRFPLGPCFFDFFIDLVFTVLRLSFFLLSLLILGQNRMAIFLCQHVHDLAVVIYFHKVKRQDRFHLGFRLVDVCLVQLQPFDEIGIRKEIGQNGGSFAIVPWPSE